MDTPVQNKKMKPILVFTHELHVVKTPSMVMELPVSVRVTDETGDPLMGQTVIFFLNNEATEYGHAITDENGCAHCTLTDVPMYQFRLRITAEIDQRQFRAYCETDGSQSCGRVATISPPEITELLEQDLREARFTVTLIKDGQPLQGEKIKFWHGAWAPQFRTLGRTNDDGQFFGTVRADRICGKIDFIAQATCGSDYEHLTDVDFETRTEHPHKNQLSTSYDLVFPRESEPENKQPVRKKGTGIATILLAIGISIVLGFLGLLILIGWILSKAFENDKKSSGSSQPVKTGPSPAQLPPPVIPAPKSSSPASYADYGSNTSYDYSPSSNGDSGDNDSSPTNEKDRGADSEDHGGDKKFDPMGWNATFEPCPDCYDPSGRFMHMSGNYGDGKCADCHGTGYRLAGECETCGGSGECQTCYGKGYLSL
jgi:hypothetical protein